MKFNIYIQLKNGNDMEYKGLDSEPEVIDSFLVVMKGGFNFTAYSIDEISMWEQAEVEDEANS